VSPSCVCADCGHSRDRKWNLPDAKAGTGDDGGVDIHELAG
jgi:hypothetical protein